MLFTSDGSVVLCPTFDAVEVEEAVGGVEGALAFPESPLVVSAVVVLPSVVSADAVSPCEAPGWVVWPCGASAFVVSPLTTGLACTEPCLVSDFVAAPAEDPVPATALPAGACAAAALPKPSESRIAATSSCTRAIASAKSARRLAPMLSMPILMAPGKSVCPVDSAKSALLMSKITSATAWLASPRTSNPMLTTSAGAAMIPVCRPRQRSILLRNAVAPQQYPSQSSARGGVHRASSVG